MKKNLLILFIVLHTITGYSQSPWLWARCARQPDMSTQQVASGIVTDSMGNVYAVGFFNGSPISFDTISVHSGYLLNTFIVKYNSSGQVLWAKATSGPGQAFAMAITLDKSGNVCIAGGISGDVFFDSTEIVTYDTAWNSFIAKFDPDGNRIFAKALNIVGNTFTPSIATDSENNIYITGSYVTGSFVFAGDTLVNASSDGVWGDVFLLKYASDGTELWGKTFGREGIDYGRGVATDNSNNVYITGDFSGTNVMVDSFVLAGAGDRDVFIAKYSSDGNVLWATQAGGTGLEEAIAISTDATGNIYTTGNFSSSSITFGSNVLSNSGSKNAYLVKYNGDGSVLYAKSENGPNDVYAYAIASTDSHVYMVGAFTDSLIFDGRIIRNPSYFTSSNAFFIAELDSNLRVMCVSALESDYNAVYSGVTSNNNGDTYVCSVFGHHDTLGDYNVFPGVFFAAKYDCNDGAGISTYTNDAIDMTIAPNPFSTEAVVSFNSDQQKTLVTLQDMYGKQLRSFTFSGNNLIIEKGSLASGIYFLKMNIGNNSLTKKIIVQ